MTEKQINQKAFEAYPKNESEIDGYDWNEDAREGYTKALQEIEAMKQKAKWVYRLEYQDATCGLWYNGYGEWCFEDGIGSIDGCKTRTLLMDYDERYKQGGRDWYSSCSNKEDLLHWYSLEDARKLISKGFVFTRYLATEYVEYEQQTVFIKETSLYREEIDLFGLFEQESLLKLKGFVARDGCSGDFSDLYLGYNKPRKIGEKPFDTWGDFGEFIALPQEMFSELSSDDEPIEVELIIRKI